VRTLNAVPRLTNRIVFLAGSVPDPDRGFARVPDAPFVIEQAVVALARAVFAEGGRIVFGAHPSISPLVASVAAEYFLPDAEAVKRPVVIYQSRAFKEVLPNDTWDMYRYGFADLIWTEAKGGEHYEEKGEPASRKCPLSLTEMRERMIVEQSPVAMVIVGGMDGVAEELAFFRKRAQKSPIYVAHATGGAAAALFHEGPEAPGLHNLEYEWWQTAKSKWTPEATADPRERPVPPYGSIMQWLVEQIAAAQFYG
jgi:hypothetical protein